MPQQYTPAPNILPTVQYEQLCHILAGDKVSHAGHPEDFLVLTNDVPQNELTVEPADGSKTYQVHYSEVSQVQL